MPIAPGSYFLSADADKRAAAEYIHDSGTDIATELTLRRLLCLTLILLLTTILFLLLLQLLFLFLIPETFAIALHT